MLFTCAQISRINATQNLNHGVFFRNEEECFESHENSGNLYVLCFCLGFKRSCIYSDPMLTVPGSVRQGCFVGIDAMHSDSQREAALQLLQSFPITQEGNISLLLLLYRFNRCSTEF